MSLLDHVNIRHTQTQTLCTKTFSESMPSTAARNHWFTVGPAQLLFALQEKGLFVTPNINYCMFDDITCLDDQVIAAQACLPYSSPQLALMCRVNSFIG